MPTKASRRSWAAEVTKDNLVNHYCHKHETWPESSSNGQYIGMVCHDCVEAKRKNFHERLWKDRFDSDTQDLY